VSRNSRDVYLTWGIGKDTPHTIVRSGIDLARFRNAPWPDDWQSLTKARTPNEKSPTMLLIAALEPRKRHLELLEAIARSPHRLPDFRLLLAGAGPLETEIKAAIARLALEDHVTLLGYRTDPERLIALSDVCLSVGTREGLPRVVIQYLTGGRLAYVVRTAGLDEEVMLHPLCRLYEPQALQILVNDAYDSLCGPVAAAYSCRAMASLLDAWDKSEMIKSLTEVYHLTQARKAALAKCSHPTDRR
jgi:glycosyltransferase involved in cell wall biosynthesis